MAEASASDAPEPDRASVPDARWVGAALSTLTEAFARPAAPDVLDRCRPLAAVLAHPSTEVTALLRIVSPAARDARHGFRVGALSAALGERIGLGRGSCAAVALGALLHDIGKALIPEDIRYTASALDDAQHALYARHPEFAVGLLIAHGTIDALTRDAVLAHHERLDGLGTPYGLVGDHVPVAGRLVAVADAYDAWMRRPGRRDPADAMAVLRGPLAAGLDPIIVEHLGELVDGGGLDRALLDRQPSAS